MVKVLQLADGEKIPFLEFVYGEFLEAKKSIKKATDHLEKNYQPIFKIIDEKMKGSLDFPLHMAAYFFNPYYYIVVWNQNTRDAFTCLDRFVRRIHKKNNYKSISYTCIGYSTKDL